jgi:hypothetical protein
LETALFRMWESYHPQVLLNTGEVKETTGRDFTLLPMFWGHVRALEVTILAIDLSNLIASQPPKFRERHL